MSIERPARPENVVLVELVQVLRAEGFEARMLADPDEAVVVYAEDPRLDPWEDPNEERQIEIVRIKHRDGHLHCPWLPGPIPDTDRAELGTILRTLMQTRGY
jgi:hypothetical protein